LKLFRLFTMLVLAFFTLATKSGAQAPATGTVTGQVILRDSHLPGRMASISLISAKPTRPTSAESTSRDTAWSAKIQSLLDGSFTIPNVPPGDYYLLVEKIGYISPGHLPMGPYYTTKEEEDSLAKLVTPITVAANRTTTVDAVLTKGASISGVLRFDDGSPDAEGLVALLYKDKSGKWAPYLPATAAENFRLDGGNLADDQGRFRFAGLPAGEYLLKSILEIGRGIIRDHTSGGDSIIYGGYAIDCYYGDGIRLKDAKAIKVADGEQSDGNDIEIPLTKLHAVSGAVVSSETGGTVNSAKLELHYADDDSLASKTEANPAGTGFNFLYVPEGEYTLKVLHAADVNRPDTKRPIRTYADASQPLIVKGELSGITIQVKPQAATATAIAQ
jgi:hypothetical protein